MKRFARGLGFDRDVDAVSMLPVEIRTLPAALSVLSGDEGGIRQNGVMAAIRVDAAQGAVMSDAGVYLGLFGFLHYLAHHE